MPVPFPSADQADITAPDLDETSFISRGLLAAMAPPDGPTALQRTLVEATAEAMTGHVIDMTSCAPMDAVTFAEGMARRDERFRTRLVHLMLMGQLTLVPLPLETCDRTTAFARELGVDDEMLRVARGFAEGSLGLALIDFERNGYTAGWDPAETAHLHTSSALDSAWEFATDDDELVLRWCDLINCEPGTLGRAVFDFYRARGFLFPGRPNSAPPLLAQHDWVHVLADYGTTVESEIEVFTFIARANHDPRAFSLMAMVISLFETGHLETGAGLFQYDPGHLSRPGMATRLADAMRRGAQTLDGPDFLRVDWFDLADRPVEEVRRTFGVTPKAPRAMQAGAVGPFEPGGISAFQVEMGRAMANGEERPYDGFGATLA
ncbi:MAG: hypothetical protein QOG87_297 [Actinomycetota bacterium]